MKKKRRRTENELQLKWNSEKQKTSNWKRKQGEEKISPSIRIEAEDFIRIFLVLISWLIESSSLNRLFNEFNELIIHWIYLLFCCWDNCGGCGISREDEEEKWEKWWWINNKCITIKACNYLKNKLNEKNKNEMKDFIIEIILRTKDVLKDLFFLRDVSWKNSMIPRCNSICLLIKFATVVWFFCRYSFSSIKYEKI